MIGHKRNIFLSIIIISLALSLSACSTGEAFKFKSKELFSLEKSVFKDVPQYIQEKLKLKEQNTELIVYVQKNSRSSELVENVLVQLRDQDDNIILESVSDQDGIAHFEIDVSTPAFYASSQNYITMDELNGYGNPTSMVPRLHKLILENGIYYLERVSDSARQTEPFSLTLYGEDFLIVSKNDEILLKNNVHLKFGKIIYVPASVLSFSQDTTCVSFLPTIKEKLLNLKEFTVCNFDQESYFSDYGIKLKVIDNVIENSEIKAKIKIDFVDPQKFHSCKDIFDNCMQRMSCTDDIYDQLYVCSNYCMEEPLDHEVMFKDDSNPYKPYYIFMPESFSEAGDYFLSQLKHCSEEVESITGFNYPLGKKAILLRIFDNPTIGGASSDDSGIIMGFDQESIQRYSERELLNYCNDSFFLHELSHFYRNSKGYHSTFEEGLAVFTVQTSGLFTDHHIISLPDREVYNSAFDIDSEIICTDYGWKYNHQDDLYEEMKCKKTLSERFDYLSVGWSSGRTISRELITDNYNYNDLTHQYNIEFNNEFGENYANLKIINSFNGELVQELNLNKEEIFSFNGMNFSWSNPISRYYQFNLEPRSQQRVDSKYELVKETCQLQDGAKKYLPLNLIYDSDVYNKLDLQYYVTSYCFWKLLEDENPGLFSQIHRKIIDAYISNNPLLFSLYELFLNPQSYYYIGPVNNLESIKESFGIENNDFFSKRRSSLMRYSGFAGDRWNMGEYNYCREN